LRAQEEAEKAAGFEQLQDAEERFGLPRLEVDTVRGFVTFIGPDSGEEDARRRSIRVRFGDDGRLLDAEPHASLGLESEAARAAAEDDLGKLVTFAWHRLNGGGG